MQKNNIKSFICSFLFSILAVYVVQKVFLRTPDIQKNDSNDIKPEKISLFSDSLPTINENQLTPAASAPTLAVDVSQIAELAEPVKPISQELKKEKQIKKEVMPQVVQIEEPQKAASVPTDLAYASEIVLPEEEQTVKPEMVLPTESEIVYADISDTVADENPDKNVVLADADMPEEIPLLENASALHHQISISENARASQIAMIEPQTLINSMEEPDILEEEKTLAEADIKKNELGEVMTISENMPQIDESAWITASAASEDDLSKDSEYPVVYEEQDSPWVAVKGNKYAKNQVAVESFASDNRENVSDNETSDDEAPDPQEEFDEENVLTQNEQQPLQITDETVEQTFTKPLLKEKENEAKLAYQMIQNILIPIPQDILNDADLTPDLTASPDGSQKDPKNIRQHTEDDIKELNENEKESGLFKSITSWFNKNKNDVSSVPASVKADANGSVSKQSKTGSIKDKVFSALGSVEDYRRSTATTIMPAELRLSFQPNRAEISGQTLRWIYAFADNARDNNDVYIEVRIDGTSSYALQQKRLNLLSSIFASRGVDYRKINTVFTSREPNSFIIRNIRFNNEDKGETNE